MSTTVDESPRSAQPGRRVDFGSPGIVLRRGGFALRWRLRSVVVCALLVATSLALSVWSLTLGEFPLSPGEVWAALINDPDAGFSRTVVMEWRMPRTLAALVFGAALGVAGAAFQSLTRNPLASPDVIGFSAGSYTGALIVLILIQGSYVQVAGGALLGGLLTAVVVYLAAWRGGVQGFRLIIAGIGISAMLTSFNTWLILTADLELALGAAAWGAGTLNGVQWDQVATGCAVILLLLAAIFACARGRRQLELGDDAAKATGTRAEPTRLFILLLGIGLTATVTAAAGPISFIALAAPQIGRRLARTPGVPMAPAACVGAFLLAAADLVAQHLLPSGLPVGVVTVVIGGSYLVWLIAHEVRRRA